MTKALLMKHLHPALLYRIAFRAKPLKNEARQHLAACTACRQALAEWQALAEDLAVTRASEPSSAAHERYYALYTQIRQQPSRLGAAWRSIKATLAWDSRQQPALLGVRNGAGSPAYRLLYATQQAEIELLIEPEGRVFRAQGEIIGGDDLNASDTRLAPALIQWTDANGDVCYETESDTSGLFSLRNVAPGVYRLTIVPATSDIIEIEALEIM
jgi:hypothetical protein